MNTRKQIDPEFTKLLGNQLMNAKAFFDWGVDRGLTTPEDMRLTVEKRKEVAKQLVNGGMMPRKHWASIIRRCRRTLAENPPKVADNQPPAKPPLPSPCHFRQCVPPRAGPDDQQNPPAVLHPHQRELRQ
jgi:hypothetical protein